MPNIERTHPGGETEMTPSALQLTNQVTTTSVDKILPAEEENDYDNEEVNVEKFSHKIEYILTCVGFAVGFTNVWRFPYMCYANGGAAFLIPYFFSFFLIAVPLFLIETSYGQLLDMKLPHRWGAIVPRLHGLKMIQCSICFFTTVYYILLLAWSVQFFFESFKSPLPWVKEITEENTAGLTAEEKKKMELDNLWNEDFFYKDTLYMSDNIGVQGRLVPKIVGCLVLSYIITYFAVWKGIKSVGQIVYVTCLLPYIIIAILLVKGLTLPGCGMGISYLFKPTWAPIFLT
jgi:SNF family Na+-dependent transporter